jgi:hypothetical protein
MLFRPLPEMPRVPGLRLCGEAFANTLMVFEFLHNFGETLGFGKNRILIFALFMKKTLPTVWSNVQKVALKPPQYYVRRFCLYISTSMEINLNLYSYGMCISM